MHTQPTRNRLAQLREAKGEKRYHLAAAIDIDPSTIFRWEKGQSGIPDDVKLKLAERYGVSVEHLMGWDDLQPANGKDPVR